MNINNEETTDNSVQNNSNEEIEIMNKQIADISYTPMTLEDDLKKMDVDYNLTSLYRSNLLNKLVPIVMNMHIETDVSDKDSASALDSQMGVINTYMSLLNDTEKSIKQKIEIKTKQRELIEDGKKTDVFIEALDLITKQKSEEFISKQINNAASILTQRISDENITVSEQELRDDPTDLS